MSQTILALSDIQALARDALIRAGASENQATSLAKAVMAAERDGIKSHGLTYVPNYCLHLECGKVIGTAEPVINQSKPGAIKVDAKSGFAHLAIEMGFEKLKNAAAANGCATLTINNSYNCGVLGYHVEQLALAGLLGLGFTNAPASIAPVGGMKPVIGTNPFALAVPDKNRQPAFVIDQSASVVAKSEIMMHAKAGKDIPTGWAIDEFGNPATDPNIALKGSMLPSGGYKGFSNGLITEIFAAVLSGAMLAIDASPFSGSAGGPPKTGQCFIAFNIGDFSDNQFFTQLKTLCDAIAAQEGARLPGANRLTAREKSLSQGVAVDDALIEKIRATSVN